MYIAQLLHCMHMDVSDTLFWLFWAGFVSINTNETVGFDVLCSVCQYLPALIPSIAVYMDALFAHITLILTNYSQQDIQVIYKSSI